MSHFVHSKAEELPSLQDSKCDVQYEMQCTWKQNKIKKELRKASLGELLVYQASSLNGSVFLPFLFHFVEKKRKRQAKSANLSILKCAWCYTQFEIHTKRKHPTCWSWYIIIPNRCVHNYWQRWRTFKKCDNAIIRNQSSIWNWRFYSVLKCNIHLALCICQKTNSFVIFK